MICPAETPEGAACGLVKNLALMAFVSVGSHTYSLVSMLEDHGTDMINEITTTQMERGKHTKIFVNGNWMGIHTSADDLLDKFRRMRRTG